MRFDVVVVGAGSAGAVMAARLCVDKDTSVLLLEAGPDHTSAEVPAGIASLNFSSPLQVPDRIWSDLLAVRAEGQPPSLYRRGRGAGGSSSVNACAAIRGTADDYDRWAQELGCPAWGWDDMLAAFVELEDDVDYGGDGLHGRGGPIPLSRLPESEATPLDRAMREALGDLGYPTCDDYHTPGATGLSRWAFTIRHRRRVSTNDAYLEAARARPNLTVRGGVLVDRVVVDRHRAVGLVTASGEEIEAAEVIVAAGAIHSPAILLRSGIGPETGLPVGTNLADHAAAPFALTLNERGRPPSAEAPMASCVLRYSSELADAGANDMQLVWMSPLAATAGALSAGFVFPAVVRVFSRGEVRLRSADPHDDPLVQFRMLSDHRDLVRLRDAVHRTLDLVHHPAVMAIADTVPAGIETTEQLSTDAAIDDWLAATVTDYVHAVGTCRMGTPGDPAAVVDTECRVIGIDGLRVCDASVMPDIPRANTHLTTVAIAERVSRMIRAVPSL